MSGEWAGSGRVGCEPTTRDPSSSVSDDEEEEEESKPPRCTCAVQ